MLNINKLAILFLSILILSSATFAMENDNDETHAGEHISLIVYFPKALEKEYALITQMMDGPLISETAKSKFQTHLTCLDKIRAYQKDRNSLSSKELLDLNQELLSTSASLKQWVKEFYEKVFSDEYF